MTTHSKCRNRDAHATASVATSPASTLPSYSIAVGGLSLTNCTSSGIVSSREYDALGRVAASTDGRGNTTTLSYDAQGRVAWTESPLSLGEGQGEGASVARTTYGYDALGRQVAVTNALGEATYTAYDAENRVVSTWGATYPVAYAYDDYGRMTAMNTFRDEAMQNGDTTTWLYHEPTGLLTNKVYADGKGPSYTYTPDGKLATRTWARGIATAYAYNAAGQLTGVDYSDTTPDVAYTYDRLGRQLSAIAAGVSTNLYAYSRYGQLTNETVQGLCASAPLRETISRATDALGRSTGVNLGDGYAVSYGYDAYGRFAAVSSADNTYTYSYLPGANTVSGMAASSGHSWQRSYEPARSLITAVENRFGETVISRFDYENDAIGRRISRADSGIAFDNPAFDVYAYNTRSEVIGAQRYHGTNPADTSRPFGGRGFGYAYDPIGNRTSASETIGGETLVKSYTANALNQYTSIANSDAVALRGSSTNTATVTVNGNAASRDSIASDTVPWHYALPADNANGGAYTFASIMAVINPPGTNTPDIVSTASGHIYAPPQAETLAYDDDGNLLNDGRFTYTWNGENRLIKAEELISPTNRQPHVVEYTYDHRGRMIWKTVASSNAPTSKTIRYLWDDYNIIAETVVQGTETNTTYNIWGLDLDGTMQGVGGVGGLLAVVKDSATFVPAWDANGNIMEYVAFDGSIVAHRECDPFGGTVVATGNADAFTHWFSTKPWCPITGLSEYQYRKYSPVMGRWLSRDRFMNDESGGLYSFVLNQTMQWADDCGAKKVGVSQFVSTTIYYKSYYDEIFVRWEPEECMCVYRRRYQMYKGEDIKTTIVTWTDDSTQGFFGGFVSGILTAFGITSSSGSAVSTVSNVGSAVSTVSSAYSHFSPEVFTDMPDNAIPISVAVHTNNVEYPVRNPNIDWLNTQVTEQTRKAESEAECIAGLRKTVRVGENSDVDPGQE